MQADCSVPPDDELVLRIQQRDKAPERADEAFLILYERHAEFIYRSIRGANERLVGYALNAEDIVEATFTKMWRSRAGTFTRGTYDKLDGPLVHVRRWLLAIAHNLIRDILRSPKHILPLDPTGENEKLFAVAEDACPSKAYEDLHRLVANTLTEREQAIVWFKIGYYDPDTGHSEPPRDELAAFCERWSIKSPALRKAYERAITKLSEALAAVSP